MTAPSKEAKRRWILNNPDKVHAQRRRTYYRHHEDRLKKSKVQSAKWYKANREKKLAYGRTWHLKNAERHNELNRRWALAHPGLRRAQVRRYQVALIRRTPKWADQRKVAAIYVEAAKLSMDVDHILPLRGKYVSGLHVIENLQILPRSVNRQKSNNYVPA